MAMTLRLPDDVQDALRETADRNRRRDEAVARLVRDHAATLDRLA